MRINNCLSRCFDVTCGLKQGCLISPLMFNMYINDLITKLNGLDRGIKVNGRKVSLLLYADDIVLLGNCARDIQLMLDSLYEWCEDWGLMVNPSKSKIVHFRNKCHKVTRFPFKCGKESLDIVDKYKYLGLWFTESLDYKYMAEQIAASAQRALGLLIAKSKCIGGFPFHCYSKLYQSLVQSILDYGACVWGHRNYPAIAAVQHRAIRSFLGVHSKTVNSAILGEMGWTPQCVLQQVCIARQLCRLSKMDESRLNRQVYEWSLNKTCDNAANAHKTTFASIDMVHMCDCSVIKCKSDVKNAESKLLDIFVETWYNDLNRIEAKKGPGHNKLRTYRLFKSMYNTEYYLINRSISLSERRALAKFRCSATPLLIETGRYQNGTYLPVNERICKFCAGGVEDEFHVLLVCPLYDDIREELFQYVIKCNPYFYELCNEEKFVFIMSHCDVTKYIAKACKLVLNRRRNFTVN